MLPAYFLDGLQSASSMTANIEHNYNQIKADVKQIVAEELKRIAEDPDLEHLVKNN